MTNHPAFQNEPSKRRTKAQPHRQNDCRSRAGCSSIGHPDSVYCSTGDGEDSNRCDCCCRVASKRAGGSSCAMFARGGCCCYCSSGVCHDEKRSFTKRQTLLMPRWMGHIILAICFAHTNQCACCAFGKHVRSPHPVSAFHPPKLHNPIFQREYKCNMNMMSPSNAFQRSHRTFALHSTTNESSKETTPQQHINPASTPQTTHHNNEYSFFDEATIYTRAGSGGQGSSTYQKRGINNQNGPPDGGNGGQGGNVILCIDDSLNTLAGLARYAWRPNSFGGGGAAAKRKRKDTESSNSSNRIVTFRAENGGDGDRQRRQGRNGKDVIVRVPPGTVVWEECWLSSSHHPDDAYDVDIDEGILDEPTYKELGTITRSNPTMIVATGGQGGEGSAINSQRGVRRPRNPPQGGERKRLKLTLKVVADVALVAVPNAGKSTLLSKVTRAKPKIADYPFTTVVPNLGVWVPKRDFEAPDDEEEEQYDQDGNIAPSNSKSLILCDVPGLIAGASDGIGLGHAFLRHVERCHVILHLLDATSDKVLDEYAMINKELMRYGTGKLASMPQVVVVNKVDVAFGKDADEIETKKHNLESKLKEVMPHSRLMWISAKEGEGVDDLMERVAIFVKKVKQATALEEQAQAAVADN